MPNEPVDWSIIQSRYGADVVRYFKHHNIQPAKTDFNVYEIPHVAVLQQCSKIATTLRHKLAKKPPKKKKKIQHSPDSTIEYNCYDIPDRVKRVVNDDAPKRRLKKIVSPSRIKNPPVDVNLLIRLDTRYKQPNRTPLFSFSASQNLDSSWNCKKVFHSIMQTYTGSQKSINYDACLGKIKKVLRKFERKHKKFKYSMCLESTMRTKNSSDNHAPHVSIEQLQQFFYVVLVGVIPTELFGNNANRKKLARALRKYFLSSWGEEVPLKSFVMSMNISCIAWLKGIPDVGTKWLIIAKLSRWLFEVYFLAILRKIFRVVKDLYSEKKIFLSSLRWGKWKYYYIKTQESKATLVEKSSLLNFPESNVAPAGTTKLYPKADGVRCIYLYRLTPEIRSDLTMIKIFLQQLYRLRYDSVTIRKLYPLWLSFGKTRQKNPDHPFYLVSSDIVNAYGSVVQTKLYDILHGMINEIAGDKICLKWLAILKPNNTWKKNCVEYSPWFSSCPSLPRIPAHSLVTLAKDQNHTPKFIAKRSICSTLKAIILEQTVWYRGTEYVLKKGLPQGFPLSSILSEIYYAHMTEEAFGIFKESGMLARYVDDFLYVTDKKKVAKQFMEQLRKGVPEYHCRFRSSKTQTNVKSSRWESTESVEYLGHRINSATLEVAPVYGDLEFRHFKSMQSIKFKNERQTLVMRLKNFSALKLSHIVLNANINSVEMILETARSAAYTMASRCVVLITKVYPKCEPYSSEIWEEIRIAVKMVERMFATHLCRRRNKQRATVMRNIQIAIWKSFYRAFAKRPNLRGCFGDSIRRMIKNRWAI